MKKRLLSTLLALAIVLGMLPSSVMGAGADELSPLSMAGGVTADLAIATVEELESFRDTVNGGDAFEGKTIELNANLNLAGGAANQWTPIGTNNAPFKGTFNGKNHVISGLYIDTETANQGLFGYLNKTATVKAVTVLGTIKTTASTAAGIAGYNSGTIENCCSNVDIDGSGGALTNFHAGIAGDNYKGNIIACVNKGNIKGVGATGGIAGRNASSAISSCYNAGAITGTSGQTGGIIGQMRNMRSPASELKNCYNSGAIAGGSTIGAVIGQLSAGTVTDAHYLAGSCDKGIGSGDDTATVQTDAELKSLTLGAPFETVAEGYPVLSWEKDTDKSAPSCPVFIEATALSKTLSGYIRGAVNSKKISATPPIVGSLLENYTVSSTDTDWIAIAMGRYGNFENGSYKLLYDDGTGYTDFLSALTKYITDKYAANNGVLDAHKATEWQRVILLINAIGGDPTAFGTYNGAPINLVKDGTYDHKNPGWQGINGLIFGLIAMDSKNYDVPQGAVTTRESFIKKILELQLADSVNGNDFGGWALSGETTDPDISAMAILALAPYYADSTKYTYINAATGKETTLTVCNAVDMALERISSLQRADGDFASWGTINCESTAQVLTALCALGIDPATDARFIKNGNTVLDGVLRYKLQNGGFTHSFVLDPHNPSASVGEWDSMATDQASCALVSYWRFENGMRRLYDMRGDFTVDTRAKIASAVSAINALPLPSHIGYKAALKAALEKCSLVDKTQRSYIRNYSKLATAIAIVGGEGALDTADSYITQLSITTPPTKTVYTEDESFDTAGMTVTLTYSDKSTKNITDYIVIPAGALKITDTAVVVKYGLLKESVAITVNEKSPWAGAGTEASPFALNTLSDLQELYKFVNTKGKPTLGLHFKLTADIDLGAVAQWTSIGKGNNPFMGTFDGDNHAVLSLTGSNGFFAVAGDSATVKSFGVASGSITSSAGDRGAVIGLCNGADVINCYNGASVSAGSFSGYSGGIIGAIRQGTDSTIAGCYNSGTIEGQSELGGIIGYISNAVTVIKDCYNSGAISGEDGIGGIVGKNQAALTLSSCYNIGTLSATNPSFDGIGGIVGGAFGEAGISNCYYLKNGNLLGTGKEDNGTTAKTAEELKAVALLEALGNGFKADYIAPVNDCYPILKWQKEALRAVTFQTEPANADIIVRNENKEAMTRQQDGSFLLPKGEYTYLVSANGYFAVSGALSVADAPQTIKVTLKESGTTQPPATNDTIETTLSDGITQRGSRRTFDVIARDKNGVKIPVICKLNGITVNASWDDNVKTGFVLVFKAEGMNTVEIKAGTATATYKINYIKAENGEAIGSATFALEAFTIGGGYIIEPCTVDIFEGENAAQLFDRILTQNGFTYKNTGSLNGGFYLSSISGKGLNALPTTAKMVPQILLSAVGNSFGAPSGWVRTNANSLGEFDYTRGSGFMYCVNTVFPNVGFADYYLSDGDVIRTQYTLAYGADIGGGVSVGGNGNGYYNIGNKDTLTALIAQKGVASTPKSVLDTVMKLNATDSEIALAINLMQNGVPTAPATPDMGSTIAPEVTANGSGEAAVRVSQKDADSALESVKKNNLKEMVIAPKIKGDAKKVTVTVPKTAVSGLAEGTKAALSVESAVAKISFSTGALATIAKGNGEEASITAERATADKMSAENKALVGEHPVYSFSVMVGKIAVSEFGGTVTISLPYTPKKGEDTEKITVYYIDKAGKATKMQGARFNSATGSIVFETNHFSAFAIAYENGKISFTDVKPSDWFYDAVSFVWGQKLFGGTSEKTFEPLATMNRAMLWTVLYRMEGSPNSTGSANSYSDAQKWVISQKLSDGTNPKGGTTREQIAVMLYRYGEMKKYDVSKGSSLAAFIDASSLSGWAKPAMEWATAANIIGGKTPTTLAPSSVATRAEVATMLQRFITQVAK